MNEPIPAQDMVIHALESDVKSLLESHAVRRAFSPIAVAVSARPWRLDATFRGADGTYRIRNLARTTRHCWVNSHAA